MAVQEKTKFREEYIIDLLRESKGESVSGHELDKDLGISPKLRSAIISQLKKKYPQIQNIANNRAEGGMYAWIEDAPVKIQNHEGYPDPTAQQAINSVEAPEPVQIPVIKTSFSTSTNVYRKNPDLEAGEIWTISESNGKSGKIYVLSADDKECQCIQLIPVDKIDEDRLCDSNFTVTFNSRTWIGNTKRILLRRLKYCIRKTLNTDTAKLMEVRKRVAQSLGIKCFTPETKVVEKEVVKEVPVEKIVYREKEDPIIPDNYVDAKTARIAMLTEERDIWKEVALRLLGRRDE